MAISINFTKTVDNAVDPSQKKTYINGAFTSASDIANFPTVGIATGSELVNVGGGNDTGKKYVFTGTAWNLAPSGGGGGSNKFIVTLTPTAQDLSGTMDKTPAEITEAYNAGRDIEFDVPSLHVKCKAMEFDLNNDLIQAGAIVTYRMDSSNLLIEILTNNITSGYETHIYSLTPVS